MEKVTAKATSKCRVLRVSIDGVRILTITGDGSQERSRQLPTGWHNMSWDALGEPGNAYSVSLTSATGTKCQHSGQVPAKGIDHGRCLFEVF